MKILVLEMLKKWYFSRTTKITRGVPTAGTNVDCIYHYYYYSNCLNFEYIIDTHYLHL